MLGGFELRYLAAVAEGKDYPEAARTIPIVVRSVAARGARKKVSEVMLASSHADDAPHVHRVAYLRAIGREPPNHDDRAAVEGAFGEHRSRGAEARAPLVLLASIAGVGALLAAGAFGWHAWTRRPPPVVLPPASADVPLPASLDAIEAAARPRHALDPVLREALPAWVIALDAESAGRARAAPNDVEGRHAAVLEALAAAHAEEDVVTAMRAFLDESEHHSRTASDRRTSGEGAERITAAILALDDAFARVGAPFYVDAILTESVVAERRRVLVTSFLVRARRRFVSGERQVVSLDLERIDTLNYDRALLGYTRPDVRYALVLTSRVEGYLVRQAIPSIHAPEESVIVRGYEDEPDATWVTPFETAVHEVLREEASTVTSRDAVIALAAAMARRRHALETFANELDERGYRYAQPGTFALDLVALSGSLELAEATTRREIRDAQAALDTPALVATYRALEQAELLSIARHEAQHRIDYEDDRLVAVPDALAAYTGRTEFEDRVNRLAERSNAELSAYLSQVAREPERARSHLVQISTFVMNRDAWGMPETYAALVIFEVIARELGLVPSEMIASRRVVRSEVARLFLAIRAHTGAEVAAAATRAWRGLYDVELPPLERAPE